MDNLVEEMVSDEVVDQAYAWLCRRRRHFPGCADVWWFRRNWRDEKARLSAELRSGEFRFGLLARRKLKSGDEVDVWPARDALVLKCLALVLQRHLRLSSRCFHLKGNGGNKRAVSEVFRHLAQNRFVIRSDVKLYYGSIDHNRLLERLEKVVTDRIILNLVGQYLTRCSEGGGLFWEYRRGLPLGTPLSPLMGAFFLSELDRSLERLGLLFALHG